MDIIESLKRNIDDLTQCISGLTLEINSTRDNVKKSLKIEARKKSEDLLELTKKELEFEQNKIIDDNEKNRRKAEFIPKNNSYRIVRSSYPKFDN